VRRQCGAAGGHARRQAHKSVGMPVELRVLSLLGIQNRQGMFGFDGE